MEEEVRDAVFGNVGTTVAFRVGPFDAEVLETIFSRSLRSDDLVNLGFAQIYLTLMIDGVGSPPFSATTLRRLTRRRTATCRRSSRVRAMQFGKARGEVEETIAKWSEIEQPAAAAGRRRSRVQLLPELRQHRAMSAANPARLLGLRASK